MTRKHDTRLDPASKADVRQYRQARLLRAAIDDRPFFVAVDMNGEVENIVVGPADGEDATVWNAYLAARAERRCALTNHVDHVLFDAVIGPPDRGPIPPSVEAAIAPVVFACWARGERYSGPYSVAAYIAEKGGAL